MMKVKSWSSLQIVGAAVIVLVLSPAASASPTSQLWPNGDGTGWDPATSRLQDFTNVGYKSGAVPIPDWPVGVDVTQPPYNAIPNDGIDDSQAFLDAIADCPDYHAVYVPNGVYTILQRIEMNRDHVVLRGEDMYQTLLDFPKYLNEIYIQEVGYENPAYDDGSNGARHIGAPKGFFRVEGGSERSIENFTFRFRNQRKMGHWEHKGASAISYSDGTEDSWIRNIYVVNGDNSVMIGYSFRLSVLNVVFDHTIDRPDIIGSGAVHRWVGHMAIAAHNSRYSLYHNVHFTGDYFHELDNANVPSHCVFSNFSGHRVSLHHHGGGSNNNLYTHASVGAGPGIASLGSTQSNETHWNIIGDEPLDLPTGIANMENYHVFVGYDADTSTLPLDANGDYITAGAWWETIDPGVLLPQNIYLAQMAYLLKPLPQAAPPAPPSQFTGPVIRINPVEDTVTDSGSPDTPQDPKAKSLMVGDDMYFKFDLTSINLSSIAKARFRVASSKFINTPVGLSVSSIPDTWSGDTITYNSAPLPMNELGATLIEEDSYAQILEFDVTSFVQTEWASDKIVSLVLKKTSGNGFLSGIRSREMGIAPELIIEQVSSAVAGPPSAPQDVRSYSLIGNVQLDWADNLEADVATYNVYRSTSSKEFRLYEEPIAMGLVSSDFVDVQDKHGTGWDIGMLRNDRVYYYRVTAVDAHGYESESSLEIVGSAKGYMDNNLGPSFNSGLVTLPAATQYLPYSASLVSSATDPENDPLYFSKINGPDWLSVSDDGTVSGTPLLGDTGTFQFAVQVNSLGSGRDEALIEITVTPGPPDAPTFVDAIPGDASAELDWSHSSEGSAGYSFAVYRSTDAGGPYTQVINGLTASTFTDTALSNGVTYYFVVTASNTVGESPFSGQEFVIPVQGLAIATNFLGGDVNGTSNWDAGLPVGQWGHIAVDGTVEPSATIGFSIVQTGGKIRNADFLGTSFSSTEWHLHVGELETRGLSLKDSSSFHVDGNGVADLGNNNKDCGVYSGSSFIVAGGTVTFGRHMRINGGTFTITGGTMTGASNTDFGVTNTQGSATMNFNGGTSIVNRLDLRGGNSNLNIGGSAAGSLTASSFVDVFGSNTFINVLPETRMSLTVSAEDEWAEAKWAAGDLTYNGQGVAELGAWASVTSADGLDTGVNFQYDSVTETLTLFTASLPPAPPEALVATPGDEESSLVWQLVNEPDVTGYKVYSATTSGGPYTLKATLGATDEYLDTGLENGVTYFYVVTAVDASANESDQSTEVSATPIEPNVAPVFTTDPVVGVDAVEDVAYISSLADDATDANTADILSFLKISGPAWLSVASNGDLFGVPENADVGLNSFTVEVSDGKGGIDTATLEISVINTNDAPMFIENPFTSSDATEDTTYSSSISGAATDPDGGDILSYSKIAGPAWLFVASNGGLSGTPENGDVGLNTFSIEVSDGKGGTDSATLEIMVINENDAPVFATNPIVGQNGFVGFSYSGSLAGTASDVDVGDVLTYTKISVDLAWLTVAANGDLSGTPGAADLGTETCTIEVSDGNGGTDTATLQITVTTAGTDFLGGDLNDPANWDNGLPNALNNPGTIAMIGTIQPTATVDFRVTQTSGTISNVNFQGTTLNGGEWNLEGGTFSVRALTLTSGTTAFKVSGSGVADLGNNNRDVMIQSGALFSVSGGTVNLGRKLMTNGGTFTITDGIVVGDTDTLIGSAGFHSGGVLNFNGGTTTANEIGLQGSVTTLNMGGDQVGSLSVVSLTSFGSGSTINFLSGTLMSLNVSGIDEWAEAQWNTGHLTYNGEDYTVLGTWATVTSVGFGDGFYFSYDSVAETLSLSLLVTDFLGGDLNDPANWDNGLPNAVYQGTVSVSGSIQPSATSNYKVTQTGGSISNADFRGTTLDGGEWNLEGGSFTTRGLSLSAGTTAFTVSGSGAASLGNNNKDVILYSGTSFSVMGGSVTFGRDLEANGGVFTVSGGVVTGDTDTTFGAYGFQSSGVLNFNGGTTTGNGLRLEGANIKVNLGGTTPGSVSVNTIIGTNGVIDWKLGSKMSLAVTTLPDWAETEWNAGRLTYNGEGTSTLGTWADVTAQDGLAANVRFDYDSMTGTLMLATGAPS